MSALTFAGLASGLDTSAMIDALVFAERIPSTRQNQAPTSAAVARVQGAVAFASWTLRHRLPRRLKATRQVAVIRCDA